MSQDVPTVERMLMSSSICRGERRQSLLAMLVSARVVGASRCLQECPKMHSPARNRFIEARGGNPDAPPNQESQAIRMRRMAAPKGIWQRELLLSLGDLCHK